MKENKFRVWDDIARKMWYPEEGLKACVTQVGSVCIDETGDGGILENRSYRMTALFYTGLHDKNNTGRETYHQDILRVYDGYSGDHLEKGGNFIIDWVDDGWVVVDKEGEYLCSLFEAIYNRGAEVIGNIYSNPELIEDEENRKEPAIDEAEELADLRHNASDDMIG